MAKATFTIADTPAARTELSLLLQIEPSQLDSVSHNGLITVEFADLLEDKAMHVLSGAVANHGFQVSINHKPAKQIPSPEPQPGGAVSKSKTKEPSK